MLFKALKLRSCSANNLYVFKHKNTIKIQIPKLILMCMHFFFLSFVSFLQMKYECEAVHEQLLVYLKVSDGFSHFISFNFLNTN